MKRVIYTCIVGGYDKLRQPEVIDGDFDYICFSDSGAGTVDGVWQIRPIPYYCQDPGRLSRYVKLLPHKVLGDYDESLWLDANISIKGDGVYEAVRRVSDGGSLVAQVPHPDRDCVYEEIAACYKDLRIGFGEARRTRRHLLSEGFPRHLGLMENNIIFRKHNDPSVVRLSEAWWEEYSRYSRRDQLSLMPVCWKSGLSPDNLLGEGLNVRNVPFLGYSRHTGVGDPSLRRGIRRIPLKIKWTWRRIVAGLFLT